MKLADKCERTTQPILLDLHTIFVIPFSLATFRPNWSRFGFLKESKNENDLENPLHIITEEEYWRRGSLALALWVGGV